VAMVITDGHYQGEDAAELVAVDYEPLPAVTDPADALTSQTLRAATAVIMADITRLLGELRGLEPPAEPYHPAIARRKARQEARERENQAAAGTPAADSNTEATPT